MIKRYSSLPIIILIIISSYNRSEAIMQRDIADILLSLEMDIVPDLLVSDAFTPLSHFNKGDLQFSLTPVYLNLPLGRDKEIDSNRDDLNCKAISVNAGYAVSDRIFTNITYTYADISGTLGYDENGTSLVRISGDQKIQSYLITAGYDLWKSEETSIPLMIGAGQRFHKIEMDVRGIWYPADCEVKSSTSSVFYFLGIAYSEKISVFSENFKVTPYLYMFTGGSPDFEFSSESNPSFDYSTSGLDAENWVQGFHFSYMLDNLSFSLSVNSEFTNYYTTSFDNAVLDGMYMLYVGMKEFAYTLTLSYAI